MIRSTVFVALLASITVDYGRAAPFAAAAEEAGVQSVVYAEETGRFLALRASGKVSANADMRSPEANLLIHYLSDSTIRLQSGNPDEDCYLAFEDGNFRVGKQEDKSSVFQVVGHDQGNSQISLRPLMVSDCYLGFSSPDSEPTCYPSTDLAATRFSIFQ